MTGRFPIKEIARQSGLSAATIDRVLNNRPHVSPQTRARVAAAVAELEGQEQQIAARGRTVFVDLLVEAPTRFSRAIRQAAEAVIPGISCAVFRPRFVMSDRLGTTETCAHLARIARRGSQGVFLKARDDPPVRDAIADLEARGIPTVTLFTDIEAPERLAHVGLDNAAAGRTAAWLMARLLDKGPATVLATQSQSSFAGEATRNAAFRERLSVMRPDAVVVQISGGGGRPEQTARELDAALPRGPISGVYSMGGGNAAMLSRLDERGRRPQVFVAHDLDDENTGLLAAGRLDVVLHHDLARDLKLAFEILAARLSLCAPPAAPRLAPPQILTPENPAPIRLTGA